MRIGIDARLIDETGVGRYIRNLIDQLGLIDKKNHYVIFLRKRSFESFLVPNTRWSKRLADIPWHSFREQLVMPAALVTEHLDLLHIPYFNVPIFYPGKFIVTIHDLTILHFDTGKASTLFLPLYKLRRLGYRITLTVGVSRAAAVIAVSEATKQEIIDHFHIDLKKIVVTHEAVDDELKSHIPNLKSQKRLIPEPYFLYVGNAYPHKNLEILLKAFNKLSALSSQLSANTKLVLVGNDDFFYRRLRDQVKQLGLAKKVIFFGLAGDAELINLYSHAIALVFPSLMEGFGLPGLEAMVAGTPVVCSDISVFHEVYGDAALYFNPKSEADISLKLQTIISDKNLREKLVARGREQIKQYAWMETAKQTLLAYGPQSGHGKP